MKQRLEREQTERARQSATQDTELVTARTQLRLALDEKSAFERAVTESPTPGGGPAHLVVPTPLYTASYSDYTGVPPPGGFPKAQAVHISEVVRRAN